MRKGIKLLQAFLHITLHEEGMQYFVGEVAVFHRQQTVKVIAQGHTFHIALGGMTNQTGGSAPWLFRRGLLSGRVPDGSATATSHANPGCRLPFSDQTIYPESEILRTDGRGADTDSRIP